MKQFLNSVFLLLHRSRLNSLQYSCNQEVLDDIRLVFKNCYQVITAEVNSGMSFRLGNFVKLFSATD
jgi:hypothetical protein